MSSTQRLALPLIAPGQAQKHIPVNEALVQLDALVQLAVLAILSSEPASPLDGDRYIIATGATGAFAGHDGAIAVRDAGAWRFLPPRAGWTAWLAQAGTTLCFDGAGWSDLKVRRADRFGIGASADETNRLAVTSPSAFFSHAGAGCQIKVNKAAPSDTASLIFQTGWSGRAEFGLAGTDRFSIKVSQDGATWREPLTIDPVTGYVGIGHPSPEAPLHILRGVVNPLLDRVDDAVAGPGISQRKARGQLNAKTSVFEHDVIQALFGQAYDGASYVGCANLRWVVDAPPTAGNVPTRVEFWTFGTSGHTEKMRITREGNVGIGTTAPSAKLDVTGAVRFGQYTKAGLPNPSTTGAGATIYVSDDVGGGVLAFSDGAVWRRVTDRAPVT